MNGPGGCGTVGPNRKQPALFTVAVRAHRDAFVFIGGGKRMTVGYEVVLGGWSNTKSALRRGYSADPKNVNLEYSSTVSTWVEEVLHHNKFVHFWFSINPGTGKVLVGRGEVYYYQ